MGPAGETISRAVALVLCAGTGAPFASASGGAAALFGGLLGAAAGNFAHQVLDFFAGLFAGNATRSSGPSPNHDLRALAAAAIQPKTPATNAVWRSGTRPKR